MEEGRRGEKGLGEVGEIGRGERRRRLNDQAFFFF